MAVALIHRKISSKKKVKSVGTISSKPGKHSHDPSIVEKAERARALIAKYPLPTDLMQAGRARIKSTVFNNPK
jgi:hypothetical protein